MVGLGGVPLVLAAWQNPLPRLLVFDNCESEDLLAALRSSQAWTDCATRFLKDYVAESNDAATATERAFANAFSGAEDSLVGFIATGKLEFRSLADSILADLARTTVRQTLTAPLAGALHGRRAPSVAVRAHGARAVRCSSICSRSSMVCARRRRRR